MGLSALMARYQAGDMMAFEQLYQRLAPRVRGFVRVLVAGVEPDDLVQTTFLQLHRARASYRPGAPVEPWVFAIAHNVVRMGARSWSRRGANEVELGEEVAEIAAAVGLDPASRLDLAARFRRLGDKGREAVWLHHIEGFSFHDIAATLGISESAAKVRAFRALAELRTGLAAGPR